MLRWAAEAGATPSNMPPLHHRQHPFARRPLEPWGRRPPGCVQTSIVTWSVVFVAPTPEATQVLSDAHVGPRLLPLATRRCGRSRAEVEPNESSEQTKMPPREEVNPRRHRSPGRSSPSDIFAFFTRIFTDRKRRTRHRHPALVPGFLGPWGSSGLARQISTGRGAYPPLFAAPGVDAPSERAYPELRAGVTQR